jgi:hypothetical protein
MQLQVLGSATCGATQASLAVSQTQVQLAGSSFSRGPQSRLVSQVQAHAVASQT